MSTASTQEDIVTEVLRERRGYRKRIGTTLSQRNVIQIPQQSQPNYEELGNWFQQIYNKLNQANINIPPTKCILTTTHPHQRPTLRTTTMTLQI
ncbi:hypothetical protein L484_000654 [Morus notabilis]|uniref:Uncharacterized protein n=1 Tax=Morus notabilis TaxID=981085 RepID=W9SE56_9ROSA|nr:hypothetical protein L484_000654 [Morus notabilis]